MNKILEYLENDDNFYFAFTCLIGWSLINLLIML